MMLSNDNSNDYNADDYNADELGQYRSLSSLSVVALVLGLSSCLTFTSPLMVVVPLAAVATALLALKRIAASDNGLSGARLAVLGLGLAVLFGTASYAREQVRDTLLRRQADGVGGQWLSLAAQGDAEGMLELMSQDAISKVTKADKASQQVPLFDGIITAALLRQDPLVVKLMDLGAGGEMSFELADASVDAGSKPVAAVFRYVSSGGDAEQGYLMVLKRFLVSTGEGIWLVDSWKVE